MTNEELNSRVESLVARAAEESGVGIRRFSEQKDLLVGLELTGDRPHLLSLRVGEGQVLLDVDGSQAMEFVEADERDMQDLEHIILAFGRRELEVLVGTKNGAYHALRTSAGELGLPTSLLGGLRSGPKEWRRIG